eukprot:scaffold54994_cov67-Phaeocystis_antarctica.AAC.1
MSSQRNVTNVMEQGSTNLTATLLHLLLLPPLLARLCRHVSKHRLELHQLEMPVVRGVRRVRVVRR